MEELWIAVWKSPVLSQRKLVDSVTVPVSPEKTAALRHGFKCMCMRVEM